jgi:hypothetical protein
MVPASESSVQFHTGQNLTINFSIVFFIPNCEFCIRLCKSIKTASTRYVSHTEDVGMALYSAYSQFKSQLVVVIPE